MRATSTVSIWSTQTLMRCRERRRWVVIIVRPPRQNLRTQSVRFTTTNKAISELTLRRKESSPSFPSRTVHRRVKITASTRCGRAKRTCLIWASAMQMTSPPVKMLLPWLMTLVSPFNYTDGRQTTLSHANYLGHLANLTAMFLVANSTPMMAIVTNWELWRKYV